MTPMNRGADQAHDPWDPELGRVWKVWKATGTPLTLRHNRPLLAYCEEIRQVFGSVLPMAQLSRDPGGQWEYLVPGRRRGCHMTPGDVEQLKARVKGQYDGLCGVIKEVSVLGGAETTSEEALEFLGLLVHVTIPRDPRHWILTDEGLSLVNWGMDGGISILPASLEDAKRAIEDMEKCWRFVHSQLDDLLGQASTADQYWTRLKFNSTPTPKPEKRIAGRMEGLGVPVEEISSSPIPTETATKPRRPGTQPLEGGQAGRRSKIASFQSTPPAIPLVWDLLLHALAAVAAVAVAGLLLWMLKVLPVFNWGEGLGGGEPEETERQVLSSDSSGTSIVASNGGNSVAMSGVLFLGLRYELEFGEPVAGAWCQ